MLSDIADSIEQSPPPTDYDWLPHFPDEDDEEEYDSSKYSRISDLIGILPEAFPPEKMLNDAQFARLFPALEKLLHAWKFRWEMPLYLPERKQYSALVKAIGGDAVQHSYEWGGIIPICQYDAGCACPFAPEDSYCFCKFLDESARANITAWEENVRAMGLDPYRELTPEEEREIEESMKLYRLQKRYGDDWKRYYHYEFPMEDDFATGNDGWMAPVDDYFDDDEDEVENEYFPEREFRSFDFFAPSDDLFYPTDEVNASSYLSDFSYASETEEPDFTSYFEEEDDEDGFDLPF
ncbi:MAG: hypothetical protein AAB316_05060 [Bacteroidota bacterium]